MARGNPENLRPVRTKQEASDRGRKGGFASGVARREKRTLRQRLELLLKTIDQNSGQENADAIAAALVAKALAGDVKAFEVVRDTVGEKPVDKMEMSVHEKAIASMTPEERREYALGMGKRLGLL